MESPDAARGIDAAILIAVALDLPADDATVLQNSQARTAAAAVRRPCPSRTCGGYEHAPFEVELAQRLAKTESPVAALEPRVEPRRYEREGFEGHAVDLLRTGNLLISHQPPTPTRWSACTLDLASDPFPSFVGARPVA